MTWTWERIISQALVKSGLIGKNQPIQPSDFDIGKNQLDLVFDYLDGEGLALPPFDVQINFNTVAGVAKYAFGPDANPPYTDPAPVSRIRPERVIEGTVTIPSGGVQPVQIAMMELPFQQYQLLSIKSTQSQPYNYSLNPLWPQAEFFLYPTPNQVYPINLTCKVKWKDTQLASGQTWISDWVSSTTYGLNANIKYLGVVYKSLQASNTGNTPTSSPTWWVIVSEVGDPTENIFNTAQIPSGCVNALVEILTLKIAQTYRLETSTMENNAMDGRFQLMVYVSQQNRPDKLQMPLGVFPWVTGASGRNPPGGW